MEDSVYLDQIDEMVKTSVDEASRLDRNILRVDSEDRMLPLSVVAEYSATISGKAHVTHLEIYPLSDSGKNLITQWKGKYDRRDSNPVRQINLYGIMANDDWIHVFKSSESVDELLDSVLPFVDDFHRIVTFLNKRDSKVATEFVSKVWKYYENLLDEAGVPASV